MSESANWHQSRSYGATLNGAPHLPASRYRFAVYTTSRHEKRVAQHFSHRGIEHFLPVYHSQRRWTDGSKVTLDLPLFPGYIFVHVPRTDRVRVLSVPGTLSVAGGTARQPVPLPENDIEALRVGLHLRRSEPHPFLAAGDRARIRLGALAGMEGVVVRHKSGFRVVLNLNLIMQSVAVEVDGDDLGPLDSKPLSCAGSHQPGLNA